MAQTSSIPYSPTPLLTILLIIVSCFLVCCESGSGRRLLHKSGQETKKEGDGGRTFPFLAGIKIPVPRLPNVVMMPVSMSLAQVREPTATTNRPPSTTNPFMQGMAALGSLLQNIFGSMTPSTGVASLGALLGNLLTQISSPPEPAVTLPATIIPPSTTPRGTPPVTSRLTTTTTTGGWHRNLSV